jgi:Ca-activated chloride channel homolog
MNHLTNHLILSAGNTVILNIEMPALVELKEVTVIEYKVPLISRDNTVSGATVTREEIAAAPVRDVTAVAKKSIRGSRSSEEAFYVDGVKVGRGDRQSAQSVPPVSPQGTEEYRKIQENAFLEPRLNPLSTFSIDVDAASYSNVRRFIGRGSFPPADAVRIEEMVNYFTYEYPEPSGDTAFSVVTELSQCPWNPETQLLHIGLRGKSIQTEHLPESNLVFLVDVSGSMDEPDKLPLVKKSLRMLVSQLREKDHVALVVYAGAAGLVLPSTPGDKKEKIYEAIENLSAGGSTAGGAGIELAYRIAKENFIPRGNNRVLLATDGDFNVGISGDDELVSYIGKKKEEGVFLTVLGYGTGNYKDGKMEQLANKGNGNFAYIDNLMEAKKVLVKEMGATLFTIAKDVKIQVEFNPAAVKEYRLIGYENRLLADKDFNDDQKDAGELGAGHHVTALYEIIPWGSRFKGGQPEVDPLKYHAAGAGATAPEELMTLKLRYKEPRALRSRLVTHVTPYKIQPFENTSDNFRFAAAVAEMGLLLRGSAHKGRASWEQVIQLADGAKGRDTEGYRAEFVRMADLAKVLASESLASGDK